MGRGLGNGWVKDAAWALPCALPVDKILSTFNAWAPEGIRATMAARRAAGGAAGFGWHMGLSTHVLDTMHGTPAEGMQVRLYAVAAQGAPELLADLRLNDDGRNPDGLLIAHDALRVGRYRLVFEVAPYFASRGVALPQPNFLEAVTLDFGVAHPKQHYHVPLLVSPWSYSTYRGS